MKRILAVLVVDILAIVFAWVTLIHGHAAVALGMIALAALFTFVFLRENAFPYRYMFPGLVTFLLFMLFPLVFTIAIGFTNWGTGHMLSFENARSLLLSETVVPDQEELFRVDVVEDVDHYTLVLHSEESSAVYSGVLSKHDDAIRPVSLTRSTGEIPLDHAWPKWKLLEQKDFLQRLELALPEKHQTLRHYGVSRFTVFSPRYQEGPNRELLDLQTGDRYQPDFEKGYYVGQGDLMLAPGFMVGVGGDNFTKLFKDPQMAWPFAKVIAWTFAWGLFTVLLTFAVGMALALLLNRKDMKGRFIYRLLLIIPYSIPFFISVLIFKGLYNKDFGIINMLIGIPIPWLEHATWAKVSCLLVNLWLGFPYMLLVLTGILQSIPEDVYEAARIDGAGPWTSFRKITMPMVMSAVAPLLVGSFAFNFNNFVGIYLLTGGGPPMENVSSPVGSTDILISYTYRLAFEGGRGQDFGLASAIAILIFAVISIVTLINFRMTGVIKKKGA